MLGYTVMGLQESGGMVRQNRYTMVVVGTMTADRCQSGMEGSNTRRDVVIGIVMTIAMVVSLLVMNNGYYPGLLLYNAQRSSLSWKMGVYNFRIRIDIGSGVGRVVGPCPRWNGERAAAAAEIEKSHHGVRSEYTQLPLPPLLLLHARAHKPLTTAGNFENRVRVKWCDLIRKTKSLALSSKTSASSNQQEGVNQKPAATVESVVRGRAKFLMDASFRVKYLYSGGASWELCSMRQHSRLDDDVGKALS
jgi:hypothetical protein